MAHAPNHVVKVFYSNRVSIQKGLLDSLELWVPEEPCASSGIVERRGWECGNLDPIIWDGHSLWQGTEFSFAGSFPAFLGTCWNASHWSGLLCPAARPWASPAFHGPRGLSAGVSLPPQCTCTFLVNRLIFSLSPPLVESIIYSMTSILPFEHLMWSLKHKEWEYEGELKQCNEQKK